MAKSKPPIVYSLPSHLSFVSLSIIIWLLLFAGLRALLLVYNSDLLNQTSSSDIVEAFANGLRFDLRIAIYFSIPLLLILLAPKLMQCRRAMVIWLTIMASFSSLLGIVELDFYREYHQRLNNLLFQYLQEDPATVLSMLWYGFPVVKLLLAWLALSLLSYFIFSRLERFTRSRRTASKTTYPIQLATFVVCLLVAVVAARGTLRQGPPLRWGDVFTTESLFANHLGLNPVMQFYDAASTVFSPRRDYIWKSPLALSHAIDVTRKMITTEYDQLIDTNTAAIRRISTAPANTDLPEVKHVVVILMESFAGRYVGALGSQDNITPNFDRLSKEGLLFTRFFSNGTRTHQGMFATMACFPNLPSFEYLMQSPEGSNKFSGLPQQLSSRGFDDIYVYNGDFAWDNQLGFFGNQGMRNFIGRKDYVNPVYSDPTWGVSDQDMFDKAIVELGKKDPYKPFYALLQTLSNHTPYAIPPKLEIEPVTDQGRLNEQLTAMRYADWALGRFMEEAKQQPWYKDSLIVIVGDHGFGAPVQLTEMDLFRHYVPMLMIAPGIQEKFGTTNDVVASQVDLVPTIMGRLDSKIQNQCWGRDLLSLKASDRGFALIKPSGNDQTVGYIKDNQIMIKPKDQEARIWQFELGSQPNARKITDIAAEKVFLEQLNAYIQTATDSLLNNTTGMTPSVNEAQ